jgi:hypothetical protein
VRATEYFGKQFVGDAASRADGVAAVPGNQLVREGRLSSLKM